MSDDTTSRRRDWLTAFFVVAALGLAGMWWLEQVQVDRLEAATHAAGDISRDHLGPSCDGLSAGHSGETFVVWCGESAELERARTDLARQATMFESVVFVGPEGEAIQCALPGATDCVATDVAAYKTYK